MFYTMLEYNKISAEFFLNFAKNLGVFAIDNLILALLLKQLKEVRGQRPVKESFPSKNKNILKI